MAGQGLNEAVSGQGKSKFREARIPGGCDQGRWAGGRERQGLPPVY